VGVPEELLLRSATELAGLVHAGELSAHELVAASLARAEQVQPALNAFVEFDGERALAAAARVRAGDPRPFAGVPIAIKNNRAVAGLRMTAGCRTLQSYVARHDDVIVQRLKAAGFIPIGTTTLPEYGILPVTEAQLFGPTRNPWDTARTPGGSSGGSAAAVAAGVVPVAHGQDGGGSLRIPAACCGLVGLKAQRGRVSLAPQGDSLLVVEGMITRTVGDTAAILDLIAGPEPGDATWAPPPPRPYAEAAAEPPGRLRIASTTLPPLPEARVDQLAVAAVADAADLLRELGHEVVEVDPPWQVGGLQQLFGMVFSVAIATGIAGYATLAGQQHPHEHDMEPMSWAIYSLCKGIDSVSSALLHERLKGVCRPLVRFLSDYDALLTPVLAERPLPIGALDTAAPQPLETFSRSGLFTPFTPIFNATGQPAIALPLFAGPDGLPLAVQLAGRPNEEGTLLALAAQLEAALPWADRRPGL
jgi:amidase